MFVPKPFSCSFPPQSGCILSEHFKLFFYGWCFGVHHISFFLSFFFFAIVIFNLHFHFKPLCIYCFKPGKLICSLPVPQKSKICRIEMQKEKKDAISRVTCDSHTAGHLLSINLLFHYSDKCDLKKRKKERTRQENQFWLLHNKHGSDDNYSLPLRFKAQ